ncbi:metallophosphoesterase [Nocardia asteroides]|uniref:metallophosphoesterase family protein n=1 Tax=Nocardia asteroides TaxID=1824 RepID=UPI0037B17BDC
MALTAVPGLWLSWPVGNFAPIRLAATADLHLRPAVAGRFRPDLLNLDRHADLLILAGDLTEGGSAADTELLCAELADLPVPVIAVLGNHDHDAHLGDLVARRLTETGVVVLEGDSTTLTIRGRRIGVAGVMGGSGGFPGHPGDPDSGSAEHRARMRRGPVDGGRLRHALDALDCDTRIAVTHFSPVVDTLLGEPEAIYPGLGCHALGEAVDGGRATLALHGHAHQGTEHGRTSGGVPVRNVSHPVLRRTYTVYDLPAGPAR